MNSSRILVTGAAGFIGSHLVEALLSTGREVVGLDAFVPYYPRPIKETNVARARANPRFTFHELDLRTDHLAAALDGVEAVIHAAAMPGLPLSWTATDAYIACNILGSYRLLEAVTATGHVERFLHVSTSSVYGTDAVGDESQPTHPASPYGVTKLAAEHLVQAFVEHYGLQATILRYFSVYGPRQRPDMAFHRFIEAMLDDREIVVYGDGEQTRTSTFVADCVTGTIAALEGGAVGEIYNIGGSMRTSVNGVVSLLEGILGRRARVRREAPRIGDQRHTSADITRARRAFAYEPTVSPTEGLEAQVAWHLEQRSQLGR